MATEQTVVLAEHAHHSVTPDGLLSDYLADLQADLTWAREQGDQEYELALQAEIEQLRSAETVRIDAYGLPRAEP